MADRNDHITGTSSTNLPSTRQYAKINQVFYRDSRLSKTDHRVFGFIASYRNEITGVAWPSNTTISEGTGINARHVRRSIRRLEKFQRLIPTGKLHGHGTVEYAVDTGMSSPQSTPPTITIMNGDTNQGSKPHPAPPAPHTEQISPIGGATLADRGGRELPPKLQKDELRKNNTNQPDFQSPGKKLVDEDKVVVFPGSKKNRIQPSTLTLMKPSQSPTMSICNGQANVIQSPTTMPEADAKPKTGLVLFLHPSICDRDKSAILRMINKIHPKYGQEVLEELAARLDGEGEPIKNCSAFVAALIRAVNNGVWAPSAGARKKAVREAEDRLKVQEKAQAEAEAKANIEQIKEHDKTKRMLATILGVLSTDELEAAKAKFLSNLKTGLERTMILQHGLNNRYGQLKFDEYILRTYKNIGRC